MICWSVQPMLIVPLRDFKAENSTSVASKDMMYSYDLRSDAFLPITFEIMTRDITTVHFDTSVTDLDFQSRLHIFERC